MGRGRLDLNFHPGTIPAQNAFRCKQPYPMGQSGGCGVMRPRGRSDQRMWGGDQGLRGHR